MKRAAKIACGVLLLLFWLVLTFFMTVAAFGSYFDHSSAGLAWFSSPLLTFGRHLIRSANTTEKLSGRQSLADYVSDVLATAAVMLFLTKACLGPYRGEGYFGMGIVLAIAAAAIQVLVHRAEQKPDAEDEAASAE